MHVTSTSGIWGGSTLILSKFIAATSVRTGSSLSARGKTTMLSMSCLSSAYKIKCDQRASMADVQVHPVLKCCHSNWLEASHNVFIRFRPKHIHLEQLHYETATNLGLLQSNMTYM